MISSTPATVLGLLHLWRGRGATTRAFISGSTSGLALSAANRVVTLGSTVLLARTLGMEQFGIYSLAIALTLAIRTFVELGLPTLLVREVARADLDGEGADQSAVVRDAVLLTLATSFVTSALVALALNIPALFDRSGERAVFLMITVLLPLSALTRILAAALVGRRELFRAQLVEFVVAPAIMLGGAAFLNLQMGPPTAEAALAFQIGANAAGTLCAAVWLKRGSRVRIDAAPRSRQGMLMLGRAGMPFLIANVALLLNAQVDTVIVGMIGAPQDVALYRIGTQSAILCTFALQVFQNVASPFIARFYRDRELGRVRQLFRTVQAVTTTISLAITICFAVVGGQLLSLLFGEAYAAAQPILVIVSAGYLVNAACGPIGTLLSMTGHEKALSRITWATALANIGTAFALGLSIGVTGVAIATALSVAGYHLLMRVYARRFFEL